MNLDSIRKWIQLILAITLMSGCVSTPKGYKIKNSVGFAPHRFSEYLAADGGPVTMYPMGATIVVTLPIDAVLIIPVLLFAESIEPSKGPDAAEADSWMIMLYPSFVCADVVGTPIWLAKKTTWDTPKWCFQEVCGRGRVSEKTDDSQTTRSAVSPGNNAHP